MSSKPLKTLGNLTLLGASTYFAYKKISQLAFDEVFSKQEKDFQLDIKYCNWFDSSNKTNVKIRSYDGLLLNAIKVENHNTDNYIILVHGIYCNHKWMIPNAYELDKLGYNLLIIDQRSSGESQGEYYTYGFKESFDLIAWTNYLIKYKTNIKIIYYGISMGAATVMMTCNNALPSNVKGIIEDCGFSTLKDEIGHVVKKRYHILKPNPILNLFELQMIDKFGFKFSDVEPGNALLNNQIPLLIIHGEDDGLVPFVMSKIIYNKQKGIKKYFAIKNCKHAQAMNHQKYYYHIDDFIKKFVV